LIPLYTDPKYFSIDQFGILGILEISALVLTACMAICFTSKSYQVVLG